MQPNLIAFGTIAFTFGGIVSFLLFGSTTGSRIEQDVGRPFQSSKREVQLPSNSRRLTDAPRTGVGHESSQGIENQIDRESLRRFLSVDPDDLGAPEELVEWGLSEKAAIEVSAAYADTIASVRRVQAELVTLETDNNGDEYLFIPAHAEKSKRIISELEKRLHDAFPTGTASVLAEIVSADVFGIDRYRSDDLRRVIYLSTNEIGKISFHDQLMGDDGKELVSQIYQRDVGDEDIPSPLAHLFTAAQWSKPKDTKDRFGR